MIEITCRFCKKINQFEENDSFKEESGVLFFICECKAVLESTMASYTHPPDVDISGLAKKFEETMFKIQDARNEVSALKKMELIQKALEQGWKVKVVPVIIDSTGHYTLEMRRPVDTVDLDGQPGVRANLVMSLWIDDTDFFQILPIN